jgi:hypothetical protein
MGVTRKVQSLIRYDAIKVAEEFHSDGAEQRSQGAMITGLGCSYSKHLCLD